MTPVIPAHNTAWAFFILGSSPAAMAYKKREVTNISKPKIPIKTAIHTAII